MRPSAPGKRATFSRSIAFQTSFRTSSFPLDGIGQRNDIRPERPDGVPKLPPMGSKARIATVSGVLVLVIAAVAAYAYDNSRKDTLADGVTIGGVDVGGMDEAEARREVQRQLLGPLHHSLRVGYDGRHWEISGENLEAHAEVDA